MMANDKEDVNYTKSAYIGREIITFYKEALLQILRKINNKITHLTESNKTDEIDQLKKEIIPRYEKLYFSFSDNDVFNKVSKERFKNITDQIDKIMELYELERSYIMEQIKKRKEFKDNSGAEVVKNLYEYEKKELTKKKSDLLIKANAVLDEEEKLNIQLCDAIQDVDQLAISEKLIPVRRKFSILEKAILEVQNKIDSIDKKISLKWPYEIYGTVSKDEMMAIYKNSTKKEDKK